MYFATNRNTDDITSFEEEIGRRMSAGDARSFLYIVPTGAESRDLIFRIAKQQSGKATISPRIVSLSEYITRLRGAVRPELELLSASQSSALLELSIHDLFARSVLEYFEPRSQYGSGLPLSRGTFEEIERTISGLQESGVRAGSLSEQSAAQGAVTSEHLKIRDIDNIYIEYERRLGNRLIDQYGQYSVLTDAFASGEHSLERIFISAFEGVRDIFVAPFVRLPVPVRELLVSLGEIGDIRVLFALDEEPQNNVVFQFQEELAEYLREKNFIATARDEVSVSKPEAFRSHLRQTLFRRQKTAIPIDVSEMVSEYAAVSIEDEVRFAAHHIKNKIRQMGMAPDYSGIAVASTDQELYAPVIRSIFSEYGIPFQLTHRDALSGLSVFHATDALLELAVYRLSRSRLRALLESPYFSFDTIDAHTLLKVTASRYFAQGEFEWHRDMSNYIAELEARRGDLFDDEFERRELERHIHDLETASNDILVFERLIARLAESRTPRDFVNELARMLSELGMLRNILADTQIERGALELEARGYAAMLKLFEELLTLTDTLGLENELLAPEFYLDRIRTLAKSARVAVRAEPASAILVTSFDQLFAHEYEHLYLLGFREGLFPVAYRRSIFMPEEQTKTFDTHIIEQRFLFYQTLCSIKGKCVISWHRGSSDGNAEYHRSSSLDELRRVALIADKKNDASSLFAPSEFYKYISASTDWSAPASVSKMLALAEDAGLESRALERMRTVEPSIISMETLRRTTTASVYSGIIPFEELSADERARYELFRSHVYSITQLETYAACAFKYFCKYILNVSADEREPEEGLESAEKGSILHKSLYQILDRFSEEGHDIRQMGEQAIPLAREIVEELYPESELQKLHPFERLDRAQLFDSSPERSGVIENFIAAEQNSAVRSITTQPRYFELVFGTKGASERKGYPDPEEPVEIGGIKIRGKIDRIDMDDSGNFIVVDYKTGKGAGPTEINNGLSLQLPLYLRIAEDLLRAHLGDKAVQGVGALYHILKNKEKQREFRLWLTDVIESGVIEKPSTRDLKFDNAEQLEEFIDGVVERAKGYVDGIASGKFQLVDASRRASSCTYCEYTTVCRVIQAEADGVLPAFK